MECNGVARKEGLLTTPVLILVLFLAMALTRGSKSCSSRCQRDWNLCAVFCKVSTFLYLAKKELLPQLLGLWKSRGTSSVSGGAKAQAHRLCTTGMSTAVSLGLVMLMSVREEECPSVPQPVSEIQVEPEGQFWGLITLGSCPPPTCRELEERDGSMLPSFPCKRNISPG